MKRIFFIAITIFLFNENSYSQNWLWAKNPIGILRPDSLGSAEGLESTLDKSNNLISYGEFYFSQEIFGNDTIGINSGTGANFLCKQNSIGDYLWAEEVSSTHNAEIAKLCSDEENNFLAIGYFQSPNTTIGSIVLTNDSFFAGYTGRFFIAKYDSNGNVIWAISPGSYNCSFSSVTVDHNENSYYVGSFYTSECVFGTDTLYNNSYSTSFILKLDPNGNPAWAKTVGDGSHTQVYNICFDHLANLFVTGVHDTTNIVFGTDSLFGTDHANTFISRYDLNGNSINGKLCGGSGDYGASMLATDGLGNAYFSGEYWFDNVTYDSLTFAFVPMSHRTYIIKTNSALRAIWGRTFVNGQIRSLVSDSIGNTFFSGSTLADTVFISSNYFVSPGNTSDDMPLISLDKNGDLNCGTIIPIAGDDICKLSCDNSGNVYLTGDFTGFSSTLGHDTLSENYLLGWASEQFFTANYRCNLDTSSIDTTNVDPIDFFNSIVIHPNPFSTQFTLELKNISDVTVYNLLGEKQIVLKNATGTIHLGEELISGMYLLEIRNENDEIAEKKIVKVN